MTLDKNIVCHTITYVINNEHYLQGEKMPAIKKNSKEAIIDAAVDVLREAAEALNAE